MDALFNLLIEDPFLLFVFGGGLIIVAILMILLMIHHRRHKALLPTAPLSSAKPLMAKDIESLKADNKYVPFPSKPIELLIPSIEKKQALDSLNTLNSNAVNNNQSTVITPSPLQETDSKPIDTIDPFALKLPDIIKNTALPPASVTDNIQVSVDEDSVHEKVIKQRSFFDNTRLPISGDMLLNLIKRHTIVKSSPNLDNITQEAPPKNLPNSHFNRFVNKIRSSLLGKPQANEEVEKEKPTHELHEDAHHEASLPKAPSSVARDVLEQESPIALNVSMPTLPSVASDQPLPQDSVDHPMVNISAPRQDETTFPHAGDLLIQLLKDQKNETFVPPSPPPSLIDRASIASEIKSIPTSEPKEETNITTTQHKTYLNALIQSSADMMKSAESNQNQPKITTSIPPATSEPKITTSIPPATSLATQAISKFPFGLFRKTSLPPNASEAKHDQEASAVAISPPPKVSLPSAFKPPVAAQEVSIASQKTFIHKTSDETFVKHAITQIFPYAQESSNEDDNLEMLFEQLELAASKVLDQVIGKSGLALPKITQGLVQPVRTMMSQDQAGALFQSLSAHQYVQARSRLNDIVNKQTDLFMAWRRSFGKFSRLFSVIAMNEDWTAAYKSMKKATELDPNEAWNWYALAIIALKLEQENDYAQGLEKSLSVSVSDTTSLPVVEALQRHPKEGAEDIFILSLQEMATQKSLKGDWSEATRLLSSALRYFRETPPIHVDMQEQRLQISLQMAEWEFQLKHSQLAGDILQSALEESYCQGQMRLKILLKLIELRRYAAFPSEKVSQWFNECTALILSFPQHHEEGAKCYRTLAHYHLDLGAFEQAEPLFNAALKLDQTHENDYEMAKDWHGLALVAKGMKQMQVAFDYWQRAQALITASTHPEKFNPILRIEVCLSLGEILLENQQMDRAVMLLEKGSQLLQSQPPTVELGNRLIRTGGLLLVRKNYTLALTFYRVAQKNLASQAPATLIEVNLSIAHCLYELKQYEECKAILKTTQALVLQNPNPLQGAQAYTLMGMIAESEQRPHQALDSANLALNQLKPLLSPQNTQSTNQLPPVIKTIFAIMGRSYLKIGHSQAPNMLRSALKYCTAQDEDRLDLELLLAQALLDNNNSVEALEILETALQSASVSNLRDLQWDISVNMARGLMRLGTLDRAESLLRQVHEQSRLAGDLTTQAKTTGAFGEFYVAKRQNDTAFTFFEQSVQLYHKSQQPLLEAQQKVQWADALIKHGRIDSAEPLLRQAEKVFAELGAERMGAETLISLARILLKQNRGDEAETCYQKAVILWDKLDNPERTASEYASLGILKMRRGKHDEAKHDWQKAKQIFEQLGKNDSVAQINNWLEMLGGNEY